MPQLAKVLLFASSTLLHLACNEPQSSSALRSPVQIYQVQSGNIRAFSLSPSAELLLVRTTSTESGLGFSLIRRATGEVPQVQGALPVRPRDFQELLPSDEPMRWAADSSKAYVPFNNTSSNSNRALKVTASGITGTRKAREVSWLEIAFNPRPSVSRFVEVAPAALATTEARDYRDQHDFIVGRPSQEGSLPSAATTSVGGLDGQHIGFPGNTGSNIYGDRIFELLDLPSSNVVWSNFPAPSFQSSESFAFAPGGSGAPLSPFGPSISITSPLPATQVTPGSNVHVVVEPSAGLTLVDLVIVGPTATVRISSAPWEGDLSIPPEQLGLFSIQAAAKGSGGEFHFSQIVSLEAVPAATIQSLMLSPDPAILLGLGSGGRTQLNLYASYSDGVERKVEPSNATWSSNTPTNIGVTTTGLLEATALGSATITATIGAVSDGVLATAVEYLLFEDGFESTDVSRWSSSLN